MTLTSPIDGIRGIAAQIVFLADAFAIAMPSAPQHPLGHVMGNAAQFAVVTFFTVSGFVIASSLLQRTRGCQFDALDFVIRRVARIRPPYLVGLAIVFGLITAQRAGVPIGSGGIETTGDVDHVLDQGVLPFFLCGE